jgi:hypothetical protein
MASSPQVSERESWHLAYGVFLFTLEALASEPEEACEAMGSVNTAWELRDDALAGRHLLGRHRLSSAQEQALRQFCALLVSVPVNDMPSGSGLLPNLTAMQHSAWETVRAAAAALLGILAPATDAHRAYLQSLGTAP